MSHAPHEIPSLHLARILRGGGDVSADGEVARLDLLRAPEHEGEPGEVVPIVLARPARWRASVSHVGGNEFWMTGRVTGAAVLECSRCLRPTETDFDGRLEGLMRFDPKVKSPHVEIGEDEQEVILFGDPVFDLGPFLAEAAALELPIVVLHSPDCKGLCPVCGSDLNELPAGECALDSARPDCPNLVREASGASDNPFAKLKGLLGD